MDDSLLEVLFHQPEKTYHIRQLARILKVHPNTIIAKVNALRSEGLVVRVKDPDSNRVLIRPNSELPYFNLRKRAFHIESLFRCGLIDHLKEIYFEPTIILFGSIAKCEEHAESDIDLFILGDEKGPVDLARFEAKLSRPIQLFVHTRKEWAVLKRVNAHLLNNVLNGIILVGYVEVY